MTGCTPVHGNIQNATARAWRASGELGTTISSPDLVLLGVNRISVVRFNDCGPVLPDKLLDEIGLPNTPLALHQTDEWVGSGQKVFQSGFDVHVSQSVGHP